MVSMTFGTERRTSGVGKPPESKKPKAPLTDVLVKGFVGVLPPRAEALALELGETMVAVRGAIANGQPNSLSALLKCVQKAAKLAASDKKSSSVGEDPAEEIDDLDTGVNNAPIYPPRELGEDLDTDVYHPDQ